MKYFRNSTSLSAAVLCVMATFAAGCADSQEETASDEGTQKAAITSRGIAVNGCAGTALFDITNNSSNFNKAINSIAIDQSAINNVTSQLWSLNSQNQLVKVDQSSEQISQNMASALSEFTNNTNAFQRSQASQRSNASQASRADTTTTRSHFDSADTFNRSSSEVESMNSGSSSRNTNAFNRAFANQRASRRADTFASSRNSAESQAVTSSFQSLASFVSNDLTGGFDAFGLAGFNATNVSNNVSNVAANNAFASRRAASRNNAFANSDVSSLARSGFLTSANTNTRQASNFFNSARAANEQRNRTHVENAFTTTRDTSVADSADTTSRASQESQASQNSRNRNVNSASSSNFAKQTQAFTSLNQLSSTSFVLQLNFNSNSQNALTSLFALNSNNNVLSSNSFNFAFPSCSVGAASIGVPILPADDAPAAAATTSDIEVGPALAKEEEVRE